jgi:hypothetical protein
MEGASAAAEAPGLDYSSTAAIPVVNTVDELLVMLNRLQVGRHCFSRWCLSLEASLRAETTGGRAMEGMRRGMLRYRKRSLSLPPHAL